MRIVIGYKRLLMAALYLSLMFISLVLMSILLRPNHNAFKTCQRFFSKRLLSSFNIQLTLHGHLHKEARLIVANHISWVDALLLLSQQDVSFIAKREVRQWPIIGFITQVLGTLYIRRENKFSVYRDLPLAQSFIQQHKTLGIFPEGTTTIGDDVLEFFPMLFEVAIREQCSVQPMALRYWNHQNNLSQDAPFIGEDSILTSLKRIAFAPITYAEVFMLPTISSKNVSRKQLANLCQHQIKQGLSCSQIAYPNPLQISLG